MAASPSIARDAAATSVGRATPSGNDVGATPSHRLAVESMSALSTASGPHGAQTLRAPASRPSGGSLPRPRHLMACEPRRSARRAQCALSAWHGRCSFSRTTCMASGPGRHSVNVCGSERNCQCASLPVCFPRHWWDRLRSLSDVEPIPPLGRNMRSGVAALCLLVSTMGT